MPKARKAASRKPAAEPKTLKGWSEISLYLGIATPTAQRWAKSGMPVKREGRYMVAEADELRTWLGREAHMPAPAEVMAPGADITAALKQSISALRHPKRAR